MKIEFNDSDNQAQILRKVIDIENEYSPKEMQDIIAIPQSIPEIAIPLLEKNIELMNLAHKKVREFDRIKVSKNINFYQGIKGRQKSLIISFCGHANRMMLPIASYLQLISESQFDVIILRDPSLRSFIHGVPAYEPNLGTTLLRLKSELDFDKYSTIRCIGVSSGGGAALYSGAFLNVKHAFSIGGKHPTLIPNLEHLKSYGITGHEFDDMLNIRNTEWDTELFAFFPELEEPDRKGAESLKKYLPSTRLACINNLKGHSIFFKLLYSGDLIKLFNRYFLADNIK